jgi:NAD(P)-dependent dehydrogenase (short-subunit alcohol dehydrogenase family)
VLRLAAEGHHVFAGVRRTQDGDDIAAAAQGRVTPLLLDVTDTNAVTKAAETIAASSLANNLAGIVNNAGIAVAGPLEFLPITELRHQLDVNVVGQVAVTQAMLPLLRRSRGRIVFIGSIAGRSALPMTGAYGASKHALEAIADALRVELLPFGVDVSIIEPGVIATPIWETSIATAETIMQQLPPEAFEYYGAVMEGARKRALGGTRGLPPERVADVVMHALFARKPRTRYLVGKDARARMLLRMLPDRLRDRIIAKRLASISR